MLELKPRRTGSSYQGRVEVESRQPRRLQLALLLLLVALIGVIVIDREFWFGPEQSSLDSDLSEPAGATHASAKRVPSTTNLPKSTPLPIAKRQAHAVRNSAATTPADAPVVASNRVVLAPLSVEVVAGNTRSSFHPSANAAKIESEPVAAAQSTAPLAAATNASEQESLPGDAARPQASYPMLAQHMNVKGSVVLQAVIGSDGVVQYLHVLSGPAILATAAQEADREWRFKPVVQNGQAVETKATITVNFIIKVSNNSETTLADSRPVPIESLIR